MLYLVSQEAYLPAIGSAVNRVQRQEAVKTILMHLNRRMLLHRRHLSSQQESAHDWNPEEPEQDAAFLDVLFGTRLPDVDQKVDGPFGSPVLSDNHGGGGYCVGASFDTIDHQRLMEQVKRRVSDGSVLRLIRLWLTCTVEEKDDNGHVTRKRPERGTPQGGVISPLLANIFLNELDRAFEHDPASPKHFANARLVRYADDFVVMARYMGGRITDWLEQKLEHELGLTINREKTRIVKLQRQGESLDFLGFTMRYDRDLRGGAHRYLNIFPARKPVARFKDKIRRLTVSGHKRSLRDTLQQVSLLNRGWSAYFEFGYPRQCFRDLNWFTLKRFKGFLRHRSQRKCKPLKDGESLYAGLQRLGWVQL